MIYIIMGGVKKEQSRGQRVEQFYSSMKVYNNPENNKAFFDMQILVKRIVTP